MIALPQRQELVADIEQACQDGAPLGSAYAELGLSARTVERWRRTGEIRADARPMATRPIVAVDAVLVAGVIKIEPQIS